MLPLTDDILVAFMHADRLADAERARLVWQGRASRPRTGGIGRPLVGLGRLLVRLGRRLECLGGECAPVRAADSPRAVGA